MEQTNGTGGETRWERPDAPLGTLIYRAGLLSKDKLESALQESVRSGRRLGEVLLQKGWIDEKDLARLLAGQKGLAFVSLKGRGVDRETARNLSEEVARFHHAIPFELDGDELLVAVADPTDNKVVDAIGSDLGRRFKLVVSTGTEIRKALDDVYAETVATPEAAVSESPSPFVPRVTTSHPVSEPAPLPFPPPAPPAPMVPPAASQVESPLRLAQSPSSAAPEPAQSPSNPPSEPAQSPSNPPSEPAQGPSSAAPDPAQSPSSPPSDPPQSPSSPPSEPAPVPAPEKAVEPSTPPFGEVAAHTASIPLSIANESESPSEAPTSAPSLQPLPPSPEPTINRYDEAHVSVAFNASPEPAPQRAPEPPPPPAPEPAREEAPAPTEAGRFRLTLELDGRDDVELGIFDRAEQAEAAASDLMARVASGEWPKVGPRFLRPERIVGIEIHEQQRYTGAEGRARMFEAHGDTPPTVEPGPLL